MRKTLRDAIFFLFTEKQFLYNNNKRTAATISSSQEKLNFSFKNSSYCNNKNPTVAGKKKLFLKKQFLMIRKIARERQKHCGNELLIQFMKNIHIEGVFFKLKKKH